MKLMMVARRYAPDVLSGTETVFRELYNRARLENEVRLVVGFVQDRSLVPPEAVAVDLRGLSKPKAWAKMLAASLREERKFRPDVVLGNSIEVAAFRAPLACIVHDLNFGSAKPSRGAKARAAFYRFRARQLHAVITVSESSRVAMESHKIVPRAFHVIHNGVDLDAFQPAPDPEARENPGLVRFAYPSRILPGKGQHLAVDAVSRLPRLDKERAHLTIVGAASDAAFTEQLRGQIDGQPVDILTNVPEMAPYYQEADVVLFPTLLEEGFGYTAIEAMSCGKPVIYFDQPAVREAMGGIGVAVPQGDVEALRDAMVELMNDPERRRDLGEEGRKFVESRYGWPRVWSRYQEVLSRLVERY
jgi:glycosyltransferase involved in cell wall biosynthesis